VHISVSVAAWIAIGAAAGALVAFVVAAWAGLKLRAARAAQAVLLGGGTADLVDFAVSLQARIDDLHRAVDEAVGCAVITSTTGTPAAASVIAWLRPISRPRKTTATSASIGSPSSGRERVSTSKPASSSKLVNSGCRAARTRAFAMI